MPAIDVAGMEHLAWCMDSLFYLLQVSAFCSEVQWTLAYSATTGPDHGQISEIAGYVNHHANRVFNVSESR